MARSNKSSFKRKIRSLNKKYINAETIKLFIILIAAIVMFVNRNIEEAPSLVDLIDVSILISFAFLFMCELIAKLITNYIDSKTEDALKLGTDYNSLINKYSLNIPHIVKKFCDGNTNYYPAILLALRNRGSLEYDLVSSEPLDGNYI